MFDNFTCVGLNKAGMSLYMTPLSTTTSSSSSSSSTASSAASPHHLPLKSTAAAKRSFKIPTVTIIYIDARQPTQLPSSPIHVLEMTSHGNFVTDIPFYDMCEEKFSNMIKLNATFGESFANEGYYLYSLKKLYSKSLVPTAFYAKNYPGIDARNAFCKGKYMIVSPSPRDELEKISHYNSVTKDGVIILNDDSPISSPINRGLKRKFEIDDSASEVLPE